MKVSKAYAKVAQYGLVYTEKKCLELTFETIKWQIRWLEVIW